MATRAPPSQHRNPDPKKRSMAAIGQVWNMNCESCSTRKIKCSRDAVCTQCMRRNAPCKYPSAAKIMDASERERDAAKRDSRLKRKQERSAERKALRDAHEKFSRPPMGLWTSSVPPSVAATLEGRMADFPSSNPPLPTYRINLPLNMSTIADMSSGNSPFGQSGAAGGVFVGACKTSNDLTHVAGMQRPILWSKSCEFCASRKIWCSREAVCNHCKRRDQPCKYPASAVWAADSCQDRHLLRIARRGPKHKKSADVSDPQNRPSWATQCHPYHGMALSSMCEPSGGKNATGNPLLRLESAQARGYFPTMQDGAPGMRAQPGFMNPLSANVHPIGDGNRPREMNCDFCAARKIRCNRESTCNQCRARGRPCTYSRCSPMPLHASAGSTPLPGPGPTGPQSSPSPLTREASGSSPESPSRLAPSSVMVGEEAAGGGEDVGTKPTGAAKEVMNKSCDFCAARKIRCSRERVCNHCLRRGQPCVYHPSARVIQAPVAPSACASDADPRARPQPPSLSSLCKGPAAGSLSGSSASSAAATPRMSGPSTLPTRDPAMSPLAGQLLGTASPIVGIAAPPLVLSLQQELHRSQPEGASILATGDGGGDLSATQPKRVWNLSCMSCVARKTRCGREEGQCAQCAKRGNHCVYPPSARLLAEAPGQMLDKMALSTEVGMDHTATASSTPSDKDKDVESTPSPSRDDAEAGGGEAAEAGGGEAAADGVLADAADGVLLSAAVALVQLSCVKRTAKKELAADEEAEQSAASRISISQLL